MARVPMASIDMLVCANAPQSSSGRQPHGQARMLVQEPLMSFPEPTREQLEFFNAHGWIVVKDAIPQADLDELESHCDNILTEKERLAYDWAWDVKEDRDKRSFRIVQSSPTIVWKTIAEQPYRKWLVAF